MTLGSRAALAAATGLAATVLAAPTASAAPAQIIASDLPDRYDAAAYAHGGGEVALLTVTGGTHDVTSSGTSQGGQPLFKSPTISVLLGGSPMTVQVEGTQFLSAGGYPFFCSVHPATMSGTLNVTGTPLARPEVKVRVMSKDLDQVLRAGVVKVKVTIANGGGRPALVNLNLGGKRIANQETATRTRTLNLDLTSKGEDRLEDRSSAKVKAEATIEFGNLASAKGTLK